MCGGGGGRRWQARREEGERGPRGGRRGRYTVCVERFSIPRLQSAEDKKQHIKTQDNWK